MRVGNIDEECSATIECIRRILAGEGAELEAAVRVTTYLGGAVRRMRTRLCVA